MKELFVTIRSNDGSWLVIPTRFDREVGDAMVVENKKYIIVYVGTRNDGIEIMNYNIKKNREKIKSGYKVTYPEGKFTERNRIS